MKEEICDNFENQGTLYKQLRNASKKTSDFETSFTDLMSFYSPVCRFEEVEG